jgi:ATP-dependent DNA helicase UvrD/PcrA
MAGSRPDYLKTLNDAQLEAATFGIEPGRGSVPSPPLLVIAGAGTGKTNALAHRVAHLIAQGADPGRIALLTFSRRAAGEMTSRAERIVRASEAGKNGVVRSIRSRCWAGTFHAIANRLLRLYAKNLDLDPAFTVLDRSDSADLMNVKRTELDLQESSKRFPKKDTCLSIYSRVVNSQEPLAQVLHEVFPWCEEQEKPLRQLFQDYAQAKQEQHVLDFDDLLLYWYHLTSEPDLARHIGERFDHVLVDEYQDTNRLQAAILKNLKPTGKGLCVVGDDAQSIYSFRAAEVENILEFPRQFAAEDGTPARTIALERNYRSTQPILAATNAMIALSPRRHEKTLYSARESEQKPYLVTVHDETAETEYVADQILKAREAGTPLMKQAVLFRAAHHSDALEIELGRRNIPFIKYGGLKFLEAAHVKDIVCLLRWAENSRDRVAAFRSVQLLPGVGPALARRVVEHLARHHDDFNQLAAFDPPAGAATDWPGFCAVMRELAAPRDDWRAQVPLLLEWYEPHLQRLYDSPSVRLGDLQALERLCGNYDSREKFLTDLTLDPPQAAGDEARTPLLDEDYLILSTIHSAKGQEWDIVYILHAVDGCIPSDMSTGSPETTEEERRILYVAMTRARNELHVLHPLRFFVRQQRRFGDQHVFAPLTRFLPASLHDSFDTSTSPESSPVDSTVATAKRIDVHAKVKSMWA